MVEEKQITPIVEQIIFGKLSSWCFGSYVDELYYLSEAINLLISDLGPEIMKKEYGDRYNQMRELLVTFNSKVNLIKFCYDNLRIGKMIDVEKKKSLIKSLTEIPLIGHPVYDIFVLYIKQSTLKQKKIGASYLAKAKWGDKTSSNESETGDDGNAVGF